MGATENAGSSDKVQRNLWLDFETKTHTHTRLTALFQDYPGEPVPER